MKVKLIGKDAYYPIEKILEEFAQIAGLGFGEEASNSPVEVESIEKILKDRIIKIYIRFNIIKKAKYIKDKSIALFIILKSLNNDNQSLLNEYIIAKALWEYLCKKYSQPSTITINNYILLI